MVGTALTFGTPEFQTPHGGPPFHGWKRGFGFGKARGPGEYYKEPSIPAKLKMSPKGDRHLAANAFWRTKSELGPAPTFGIGPRPEYAAVKGTAPPDNYGDVGPAYQFVRRNATRRGITMKPLFPSPEQKFRERGRAESGPGPAKYDTSYKPGQSSWCRGVKSSSWTMLPRPAAGMDLVMSMRQPGPGDYEGRWPSGKNPPIAHGTLYDIGLKGRLEHKDNEGNSSPGPARYNVKGELDQYTLGMQIKNTKVGPDVGDLYTRSLSDSCLSGGLPEATLSPAAGESPTAASPAAASPTADSTQSTAASPTPPSRPARKK